MINTESGNFQTVWLVDMHKSNWVAKNRKILFSMFKIWGKNKVKS